MTFKSEWLNTCLSAQPTQIFPSSSSLLSTYFCTGLPKSSEQAYIEFESIEAIVKTASRTKFFIEFYSTCLEGEVNVIAPLQWLFHAHRHKYNEQSDRRSCSKATWPRMDAIKMFLLLLICIFLPPSWSQAVSITFKLESIKSIFHLCCAPATCPPCTFKLKCNGYLNPHPALFPTVFPLSSSPSSRPCISLSLSFSLSLILRV